MHSEFGKTPHCHPSTKDHVADINYRGGGAAEHATLPHPYIQARRKFSRMDSGHLARLNTATLPVRRCVMLLKSPLVVLVLRSLPHSNMENLSRMGSWQLARLHTANPPLRKGQDAHINSGGGGVAEPATLPHHHTQTLRKFTDLLPHTNMEKIL